MECFHAYVTIEESSYKKELGQFLLLNRVSQTEIDSNGLHLPGTGKSH
jgi:hypothetical protein